MRWATTDKIDALAPAFLTVPGSVPQALGLSERMWQSAGKNNINSPSWPVTKSNLARHVPLGISHRGKIDPLG